jgi:hypothetical protein
VADGLDDLAELDGAALAPDLAAEVERCERALLARRTGMEPARARAAACAAFRVTHEVDAGRWRRRAAASLGGPDGVVIDLTRQRRHWHR